MKKRSEEAGNVIDGAKVRTRAIEKKLRAVEELPAAEAQTLPAMPKGDAVDDDDQVPVSEEESL